MSGPNVFYDRLAESLTDIPDPVHGGSGYFSEPSAELDPNLFDGTHLKPSIRDWILGTLREFFLATPGFDQWAEVWLAGSGITYQWAADRGNGDLDVLIGVNYAQFTYHNDGYAGLTAEETARYVNESLRNGLWPKTAHSQIGSRTYEVTFYWNPARGVKDITSIHPYAAYSLTHDEWTVTPPHLPSDVRSLYPTSYYEAATEDEHQAKQLLDSYRFHATSLSTLAKGSPAWMNHATELRNVIAKATSLFDAIHLGRRAAFSPQGSGYSDFNNFRWQAAKENGTVHTLRQLKEIGSTAQQSTETDLYGQAIDDAQTALIKAALWSQK
ncbi:hypothetical protein ADL22_12170 [Streptomyces sp. NRRL F-4489]|uniref:hypothetical protein n=1 Tax=Streptomyces sp. NRRL F-4489 TaxID=1609095 RepID=UPI0007465740|nr:hypothetical protein [Streptomyces sp. NRRL F-4489]KUL44694.1 hypothetical protein ADL22_12170 [Streptomyces sp. NRRL F-4489]